jgi:hypothetical protein
MIYLNFRVFTTCIFIVCNAQTVKSALVDMTQNELFDYVVEQFVDSKVLRYQIPEWRPYLKKIEISLLYYSGMYFK